MHSHERQHVNFGQLPRITLCNNPDRLLIMKRRHHGGIVRDSFFRYMASRGAKANEHYEVYGPIECGRRKYSIAIFYPRRKFYQKLLRDALYILPNAILPNFYFKVTSYSELATGMLVLDDKANRVPYDKELFRQLGITTKVWLDTYITPFLPPNIDRIYKLKLKLLDKLIESFRERKYPEKPEPLESTYFERLKRADSQALSMWETLKEHAPTLALLSRSFRDVSDDPSDLSVERLRMLAKRAKSHVRKLADWCDERADSWPDFVDANTAYRAVKGETRSSLRKYGPRAIFDGIMGVIVNFLSGGSIPVSLAFTAASDIGFNYAVGLILTPKWQAKSLRKSARGYRALERRIDNFLAIFDFEIQTDFVRGLTTLAVS